MATLPRSLRIPEDVWSPAVERTRAEGTSVTAVVVDALRTYLDRPAVPATPTPEEPQP